MNIHLSACSDELIKFMQSTTYRRFLDCTFGVGNHSNIILNYAKEIYYVCGLDYDIKNKKYADNIHNHLFNFFHMNFSDSSSFFVKRKQKFDFVIFDFGIHDIQMYENCSYMYNTKLNVNFNNYSLIEDNAVNILNTWSENRLSNLFKHLSDEPLYKKVAKNICLFRKINRIVNTYDLKNAICAFYHHRYTNKCLGRIIQSLRMYINKEIENIVLVLQSIHNILDDVSCLFFITFHSIEDRIIKNFSKGRSLCYGNEDLFRFLGIRDTNYFYKCTKSVKNVISGISDKKRNNLKYKMRILYS